MSNPARPADESLPLSLERHIDAICLRFESAWRQGPPPSIERYLTEVPVEVRATLLRELVAVELVYRRQDGESPTLDEYQRRFPDQTALLEEAFARAAAPRSTRVDEPPAADHPPQGSAGSLRYLSLRLHARGGLGEVHVAQDAELQRQVALKRIQPRYVQDPDSRRRFLREAEITGQLEHPGVVPVYGLVQDGDGQPCYAMRFVQGESLRAAIRRFHEADQPGRDPAERRLALRELLGRFIAVCNTVAYAHSRGVLHRDLKPANVMLGQYGETLVVDWGLAKTGVRGQASGVSEEGSPARSASGGTEETTPPAADGEEGTQPGQAMGTPPYMSPEQAAGRWDEVGPASDIYSLGATLYELPGEPASRSGGERGRGPGAGAAGGVRAAAAGPAPGAAGAGGGLPEGDGVQAGGPLHDGDGAGRRRGALAGGRAGVGLSRDACRAAGAGSAAAPNGGGRGDRAGAGRASGSQLAGLAERAGPAAVDAGAGTDRTAGRGGAPERAAGAPV